MALREPGSRNGLVASRAHREDRGPLRLNVVPIDNAKVGIGGLRVERDSFGVGDAESAVPDSVDRFAGCAGHFGDARTFLKRPEIA